MKMASDFLATFCPTEAEAARLDDHCRQLNCLVQQ